MLGLAAAVPLVTSGLAACSIQQKLTGTWVEVIPAENGAAGRQAVVTGDWDDVYRSVQVSTDLIEGAILGKEDGPDWVRVKLVTIDDEPGELLAQRLEPPSDKPGPIRLTAKIGLFGDPKREERLVRAVADRLRELAGKAWAPVR